MIARLLEPTAGAVFLEGEEITKLRRRALRPFTGKCRWCSSPPAGSFDPRRTLGHGIAESLEKPGPFPRRAAGAHSAAPGALRPAGGLCRALSP